MVRRMASPTVGANFVATTARRRRQGLITIGVVAVLGVTWAVRVGLIGGSEPATPRRHPPADVFGAVTADQARAFAGELAAALVQCGAAVDALEDPRALTANALGEQALTDTDFAAAAAGVGGYLSGALCDGEVARTVLGVRDRGFGPYVVVRVSRDALARYWELDLGTTLRDRRVRVVDARDVSFGLRLSANEQEFVVATAELTESEIAQAEAAIGEVQVALSEGRGDRARELLAQLPAALQQTQGVRLYELNAAAPAQLAAARDRYRASTPDALQIAIEAALDRRDADAGRAAVDQLEQHVGPDAYVAIQRSRVELLAGRPDAAVAAAQAATQREPTLRAAWDAQFRVNVAIGNTAAAVLTLDEIEHRFGAHFTRAELEADPTLAGLVASLDYKLWMNGRQP